MLILIVCFLVVGFRLCVSWFGFTSVDFDCALLGCWFWILCFLVVGFTSVDFDCVFLGCWFLIVCSLVSGFTSVGCLSTPTSCVEFDCVFVACWWICRHRQFISIQSIHYNISQLNSIQININSIQPIQFNSINSVQQCLSN